MEAALKSRIVMTLKKDIAAYSPQMKVAAKYIIDNPSDFGLDPIRDTAKKASVSTYTLVNMAKTLGFSGYDALRDPFRHALVTRSPVGGDLLWLHERRSGSEAGAVFADAAKNAMSIVHRSLENQPIEALDNIVDLLIGANSVYLTGARSSFAMAYYLQYVGRMAIPSLQLIPRHVNSAIDDLIAAKEGDVLVAITVSPYSRETMQACLFAQERGVQLVLITDSELVTSEFVPEHTLVVSTRSTHHFGCFSGMMAVLETLVSLLMERAGTAAQDRVKAHEKMHMENNAYRVAQKKH